MYARPLSDLVAHMYIVLVLPRQSGTRVENRDDHVQQITQCLTVAALLLLLLSTLF